MHATRCSAAAGAACARPGADRAARADRAGLAWELWLAPTGSGTLALKVLPLVLCLAGLLRHRMYTYRWLSLLLWLYVDRRPGARHQRSAAWAQQLAVVEVVLCLVLFAACGVYIRRRLRSAPEVTAGRQGRGAA